MTSLAVYTILYLTSTCVLALLFAAVDPPLAMMFFAMLMFGFLAIFLYHHERYTR